MTKCLLFAIICRLKRLGPFAKAAKLIFRNLTSGNWIIFFCSGLYTFYIFLHDKTNLIQLPLLAPFWQYPYPDQMMRNV